MTGGTEYPGYVGFIRVTPGERANGVKEPPDGG